MKKKLLITLLIVALTVGAVSAKASHFGIGGEYTFNKTMIVDPTNKGVEAYFKNFGNAASGKVDGIKSSSMGLQLNSYSIFGNFLGLMTSTGVDYSLNYNLSTSKNGVLQALGKVADSTVIDVHTLIGLGACISFSDYFALLLGAGGSVNVNYANYSITIPLINKTESISNVIIGLGAGGDVQARIRFGSNFGINVGASMDYFFKHYNVSSEAEVTDLGGLTVFSVRPYVLISF